MNVNLHIERLVLDGISIPPGQRPHLQAAVEGELTRLLAEGGAPSSWPSEGAVPYVSGESMQLGRDSNPKALGSQIAQAVYRGGGR